MPLPVSICSAISMTGLGIQVISRYWAWFKLKVEEMQFLTLIGCFLLP